LFVPCEGVDDGPVGVGFQPAATAVVEVFADASPGEVVGLAVEIRLENAAALASNAVVMAFSS
jgi:hypothetical protein